MTSIYKMEMANTLIQKSYIKVEKSFFGLKTNFTYLTTNSPLIGTTMEFDPTNGQKAQKILSTEADVLDATFQTVGRPKRTENGNFLLQLCYAKDRSFAATQLLQFANFEYHIVSEVRIAEGPEAEKILRFFVQ